MATTLNYDSDYYEDDAIKKDMLKWITFKQDRDGPLDDWLKAYVPSQINSRDGVAWVAVSNRCSKPDDSGLKCDVVGLAAAWEQLQESGKMITYDEMCSLAQRYRMLSGKWFMYVQPAVVDMVWEMVAKGMDRGKLSVATGARVSTTDPTNLEGPIHSLYICNDDFMDNEQIIDLENQIRDLGIKERLMYKPDIYTALGIYRRNKWQLRPTIYMSTYNFLKRRSNIETLFRRDSTSFSRPC